MEALITSIRDRVETIGLFNYINIWNNQVSRMNNNTENPINNPSCFIELQTNNELQLPCEYQGYDIDVVFHIVQDELNTFDTFGMDSQISIYKLRDELVKSFSLFRPFQGGFMTKISESQDRNHTNLYHYTITYRFHYIEKIEREVISGTISQIIIIPDIEDNLNV